MCEIEGGENGWECEREQGIVCKEENGWECEREQGREERRKGDDRLSERERGLIGKEKVCERGGRVGVSEVRGIGRMVMGRER